ncbi:hypothetical protein [Polluticoccus soli]|uniref:hypothetical protein n=1 Tax=Polluticoccus soli TaxID=3034150 RepID=UPI0023E1A58F|nr:hypothetical protein [Flavipsychrobacter sp. JY13-12]
MKRLLLMVGLSLATLSVYAQATRADRGPDRAPTSGARGISATSSAATEQIVLACINQPGFEKYYAANGKGAVNVMGLPAGVQLAREATARGRSLSLRSTDQIASGSLSNYFVVGAVKNEGKQVAVSLTYFYNHTEQGYKVVMVDMDLVQNGDQYQIVNADFKGDLL